MYSRYRIVWNAVKVTKNDEVNAEVALEQKYKHQEHSVQCTQNKLKASQSYR